MKFNNTNFPKVSVVIPVKNEVAKIRKCIEGIINQTVPVLEIIVIDSGSTDGTLEILREYPIVKTVEIPASTFNHGETRNLGISQAKGEFVLLTVGDARACNNFWIEELLGCFDNENVAGVCGLQVVPHEIDKNPIEWFRPQSPPQRKKYAFSSPYDFRKLPPSEKKRACSWDDVNAMYRKSIKTEIPFQKTSYCEDMIWAREALILGYELVYNPVAKVYHYHLESPDFTFKRTFTVQYYQYKLFGLIPQKHVITTRKKLSWLKTLTKAETISLKDKWKWVRYNFEIHKAIGKASKRFLQLLSMEEIALDQFHEKICGTPPIPSKVKFN